MEKYLTLQKKQSSKDTSTSLKENDKKWTPQDEGDQREDTPSDRGSEGKSGSKKPKMKDKNKAQTPVHTDKKKALEGFAPSHVEARFGRSKCARGGMDNHQCKFCRKSIVASSSKGKKPKPKDDHPKYVLTAVGAAGNKPKAWDSALI